MRKLLAMGVVLALVIVSAAWAAGGRDKGFGRGGFTLLDDPAGDQEYLGDLTVLPNGKIVAVGGSDSSAGYLVARFNRDGRPDRGFGGDGVRVQPFSGGNLEPRSLQRLDVDSKGRILAAGLASGPFTGGDAFGIARYSPSGIPDPTFGEGGTRIIQPPDFGDAFGMDVGPGDKVVAVGGARAMASASKIAVVRLTAAGPPDLTLGPGGLEVVDIPGNDSEQAQAVKVLSTGAIVVAGGGDGGGFIGKLDPGGDPIAGFGTAGFAVEDLGEDAGPSGDLFDIAMTRGGRFVVVGDAEGVGGDRELVAARFKPNGLLDGSFGSGGIFRLDPTPADDSGFAVAMQPDGRLVIAGLRGEEDDETGNTWLTRLTKNGKLDRTFGGDGQVIASAVPGVDAAYGVALQPDGAVVVAGYVTRPSGDRLMVARFRGDPPCFGRAATITGTPGRDNLRGTRGPDVINALAGADTVRGATGADLLCGGPGADKLRGGKGGDRIDGGPGPDRCAGGRGRDALRRCDA